MKSFDIKEGEEWAGSMWARRYHRVSGLTCFQGDSRWRFELDMSECPDGTTIKLCGLAWISPNFKRVQEGGWRSLFSLTHEDSDRVIAVKQGDFIALKTYQYRSGRLVRGFKSIGLTRHNQTFSLCIEVDGSPFNGAIDYSLQLDSSEDLFDLQHVGLDMSEHQDRLWLGTHRSFAHAIGYNQPHAPADIRIKAKVI